MCSIWNLGNKDEEIDIQGISILAGELKKLGVVNISLGGGEPFMRDDLADIVSLFSSRGIEVRVLTNGVLADDKKIRDLVKAGLKHVSVSLDSLDSAKQKYICGDNDTWKKITENMRLFARSMPGRGSILIMNTVVSRLNLAELPELADFASEIGFYVSFSPVELNEPGSQIKNPFISDASEFRITRGDYDTLHKSYARLMMMKKRKRKILNSTRFLQNSIEYLKTGHVPWKCDAGRLYFSIDPGGRVSPCYKTKPLFYGPTYAFHREFKSPDFQLQCQKEVEACNGCFRPCWVEVSYSMRDPRSFYEMSKIHLSNYLRRT